MVGGPRLQIKSNAAQGPETEETEEKTQSQCRAILAYKCIESNRVTKG